MKEKRKKPSINQIISVVDRMIMDMEYIKHQMVTLTTLFDVFIEFTGKGEEFKEFAKKELKKRMEKRNELQKDDTSDRPNPERHHQDA
tara:strand:+ start:480 stop:743 length:264 start_codon:yes stop_codon:yes gene_type:complete